MLAAFLLFVSLGAAVAEEPAADASNLVPARLLPLLHAAEVQKELALTEPQIDALEDFLAKVDAVWFPARILPPDKGSEIVRQLEARTWDWLEAKLKPARVERVRQLEMQAQGVRMMLRSDVQTQLKLTAEQVEGFVQRARATEEAQLAVQQAGTDPPEEVRQQAVDAATAEQEALRTALTGEQHAALWKTLGKPLDTAKLKRIYPLAPEFAPVDDWINSSPLTMESLRGQVVLVHFYAFQCSNCHANFPIYKRWHETLREKGVVVVGIQTPETAGERDPARVKAAAAEQGLEFPILVDLESKNWAAWGNTMWPTVYVVDKRGYIRRWWQGELKWQGATGDQQLEATVDELLAEPGPKAKS